MSNIPALIRARHMTRHYTTQDVSDHDVATLIEAATLAPSPHNRQPWRFVILRGMRKDALAQTMAAQLRADLTHDGVPTQLIERDVQRSTQRIMSASVAILTCLSMAEMDRYTDARRNANERWMAGQAVACATQNILLTAAHLGLGACWMCAPLFCGDLVRGELQLAADWEPQAVILIGHAADTGKLKPRRPIAEIVRYV